jgi:cytochrome c oxidase cbb3-type subunit II
MSFWNRHQIFEKNSIILIAGILVVIAIGGLVEITPLFYLKSTIEVVDGVRPYTPLELAGRNIYVREGCYLCHSQMIRPLRDEVERYGHYSLAAESMYDHPFQWGSKRTGPDLARVGAKYSDEWHVTHLTNPRAIVPQSVMPGYPFLAKTEIDLDGVADHLRTQRAIGVPYSDEQIANAVADLKAQVDPDNCRHGRVRQALSEGGCPQFRRQAGGSDRDGRAGRLFADAGHPGRLQALQRKSKSSLTRQNDESHSNSP